MIGSMIGWFIEVIEVMYFPKVLKLPKGWLHLNSRSGLHMSWRRDAAACTDSDADVDFQMIKE